MLITGCTGFLAGHLVPMLRADALRCRITGSARSVPGRPPEGFDEVVGLDLRDCDAVREAIARLRPDCVVHLASRRDGELRDLLETNAVGTGHLLEAVRDRAGGETRVLVVGSAAEIGQVAPEEMPLAEDAPCRPIDPYGISKLAQAAVTEAAFRRHGQDVVRARLFNLIGPAVPTSLLPGRCVELLLLATHQGARGPLRFRDLSTERDYTDVRDTCRALVLALRRGRKGALYHVGSGRARSGRQVVECLLAVAREETGPVAFEESVPSPFTVPVQVADARRARDELGWEPEISFERSISDLWRSAVGHAAGAARDAGARES